MKERTEYHCQCGVTVIAYTEPGTTYSCRRCGREIEPFTDEEKMIIVNPKQEIDPFVAQADTFEYQYNFGEDWRDAQGRRSGIIQSIKKILTLILPGKSREKDKPADRELIPGLKRKKSPSHEAMAETCEHEYVFSKEPQGKKGSFFHSLWQSLSSMFDEKNNSKRY